MPWSNDPCPNCGERAGYDLLDYLCNYCYGELIIIPLQEAEYLAAQEAFEAICRRYRIEVALGLRARPSDDPLAGIESHNYAPTRRTRSVGAGRTPAMSQATSLDEALDDDE